MRVRQHDRSDCGAACLASICAFYGLEIAVARIRQYAGTNPGGTTVLGIIEAAAKLGMSAKGIRVSSDMLSGMSLPAIAHTLSHGQSGHYLVIVRVSTKHIIVMDPEEGRFRKLSPQTFSECWTGVLVLLSPDSHFRPGRYQRTGRRLITLALPERRMLLMSFAGAVCVSVLGLSMSLYLQQLVDTVLAGNDTRLLDLFSTLMIGLLLVQLLCGIGRDVLTLRCSCRIESRLILQYYDHLLHLPQEFFDRMQVGEIMSRINDAVRISSFINEAAIGIVLNMLTIVFSLAVMFVQRWELALMVLAALPVYLLIFLVTDTLNRIWQRKLVTAGAAFDAQLAESLAAAGTLKKLGLEKTAYKKTDGRLRELLDTGYRYSFRQTGLLHSADFITRSLAVILLWAGCYLVIGGRLSQGELFAFFALTGYLTNPLLHLLGAGKQVRDTQIAVGRLFEVMELDREKNGNLALSGEANIMFSNVSFGYGQEEVLRHINLNIPQAGFIGITGGSGAGKSTIAALLQKIYLPAEGNITINGTDILDIDNNSLRGLVVTVPQHTDLFSGTVAENISIGTAETDMDLMREICEQLGVTDFIDRLPDGFNTVLTGQGNSLSGGERQRLAIARALYRRPAVLILDEATSALDIPAEKKVMQTLEWYNKKGATIIVIAHRYSVLENCPKVLILENGFLK